MTSEPPYGPRDDAQLSVGRAAIQAPAVVYSLALVGLGAPAVAVTAPYLPFSIGYEALTRHRSSARAPNHVPEHAARPAGSVAPNAGSTIQ
jgi:hypothetical protein